MSFQRLLLQRLVQSVPKKCPQFKVIDANFFRLLMTMLFDHARRFWRVEWRRTGKHLVKDDAKCINVGTDGRTAAGKLLGSKISDGVQSSVDEKLVPNDRSLDHAAEIDVVELNKRPAFDIVGENYILGPDRAVKQTFLMDSMDSI